MASTIFGISASDILAKLVPNSDAAGTTFDIGDGGTEDLTTAQAEAILNIQEGKVLMRLNERYRRMMTRIEAEVVTRYATDQQTSFQLDLYPVSNVKLYRDYSLTGRGWSARNVNDEVDSDDYSVNLSTGEITFTTGLPMGASLLAEYNHTYASTADDVDLLSLRDYVVTLAAVEISRRFLYFQQGEAFETFTDWESSVMQDLTRLSSIPFLDAVDSAFPTKGDRSMGYYNYIKGI